MSQKAHENKKDFKFFEKTSVEEIFMSYVRWEVVPSTRRRDGESPVAECRVNMWHGNGQRIKLNYYTDSYSLRSALFTAKVRQKQQN